MSTPWPSASSLVEKGQIVTSISQVQIVCNLGHPKRQKAEGGKSPELHPTCTPTEKSSSKVLSLLPWVAWVGHGDQGCEPWRSLPQGDRQGRPG